MKKHTLVLGVRLEEAAQAAARRGGYRSVAALVQDLLRHSLGLAAPYPAPPPAPPQEREDEMRRHSDYQATRWGNPPVRRLNRRLNDEG